MLDQYIESLKHADCLNPNILEALGYPFRILDKADEFLTPEDVNMAKADLADSEVATAVESVQSRHSTRSRKTVASSPIEEEDVAVPVVSSVKGKKRVHQASPSQKSVVSKRVQRPSAKAKALKKEPEVVVREIRPSLDLGTIVVKEDSQVDIRMVPLIKDEVRSSSKFSFARQVLIFILDVR